MISPVRVASKNAGDEREDVVEHRAPQVGDHALAERSSSGRSAPRSPPTSTHGDADHRRERGVEQARLAAAETRVDHELQALPEREHAARGDHQRDQRRRDLQAVGRDKAARGEAHAA